jgi:hypothetical protein
MMIVGMTITVEGRTIMASSMTITGPGITIIVV